MLTQTDRTALASLASHLAPSADASVLHAFIAEHPDDCADELTSEEGSDQLRTVLIRAMSLDDSERSAVRETLLGYPKRVEEQGRTVLLRRHPAWVGLAWLELVGGPAQATADQLDQAVALASAGFASATLPGELGPGETLWAMAEQAEGVGWVDRYESLMDAALDADFADPAQQAEVRLLVGLHRAQKEQQGADALLDLVHKDEAAELRTRIHAAWVLAHRDASRAEDLLEQAVAWAREDDADDDVTERLAAALTALRAPSD